MQHRHFMTTASAILYVCSSLLLCIVVDVHSLEPYRYLDIFQQQQDEARVAAAAAAAAAAASDHLVVSFSTSTSSFQVDSVDVDDDDKYDGEHDDVQELYMTQKLDHFDPSNTATYQQRYFASYRYAHSNADSKLNNVNANDIEAPNNVITFLCVGGEGPGFEKSVLVDSVHCTGDMLTLAAKLHKDHGLKVHLYALEHRYYGSSYPVFAKDGNETDNESPVTTSHLKYLSSRQALEDLAHFVHVINSETDAGGDNEPNTWITFGGSYPGYLSLNARYKYPHLIHAAVSSSAPLQLEVDFPGYKSRQGWDLKYSKVGGSQECFRIVKVGHEQAVSLLTSPQGIVADDQNRTGAEVLATMFHVCDPSTALLEPRNAQLLLGDGLINIPAQSNDPSCDSGHDETCNIAGSCEFMVKAFQEQQQPEEDGGNAYSSGTIDDDPPKPPAMAELQVLVKVADHQRAAQRRQRRQLYDECMGVDFQAMLKEWSKTTVESFGWRSWLWQTCTEVGFYQTCLDKTDCPFASQYHTVDMDLEICQAVYNMTPSQVYDNIQSTLDHYGGMDIDEASRVLSVNGNVDPWSVLALQTSPKYSLPVAWAEGASHHFWTHPVKDTDAPEIVRVRNYIHSVVMDWLGLDGERIATKNDTTSKTEILTLRGRNDAKNENSASLTLDALE